jgi:hypothetical protein
MAARKAKQNDRPVIVRTYSAGVFFAVVKSRDGKEAVLVNSRRLWRWRGAAELTQLAEEGVSMPSECKFSVVMAGERLVTEVIEILAMSDKAISSIEGVPEWRA